jgi:hypothetical protein
VALKDQLTTNYKHALIFWQPYGSLSDSVMIELFSDFDQMQARHEVIRKAGYRTRIESPFNLLEYLNV